MSCLLCAVLEAECDACKLERLAVENKRLRGELDLRTRQLDKMFSAFERIYEQREHEFTARGPSA